MGGPWAKHKKQSRHRENVARGTTHGIALVLLATRVDIAALVLRSRNIDGRVELATDDTLPYSRGREAVARALRCESARDSAPRACNARDTARAEGCESRRACHSRGREPRRDPCAPTEREARRRRSRKGRDAVRAGGSRFKHPRKVLDALRAAVV